MGTGVHVFKNHFMSIHLHQKLAFVIYPQINRLDTYIKSSLWLWARCLKNAFVLNDLSLKQKKFVIQMSIIYRYRSTTPATTKILV